MFRGSDALTGGESSLWMSGERVLLQGTDRFDAIHDPA